MSDYQIFDRALLKKRLQRALSQQGQHDFLHRLAAERLRDRLADVKKDFSSALQWGDVLDDEIRGKKKIDFIADSLKAIVADEEFLPFAAHSFDLIASNLTLQLVNDLPGALLQIRKVLKPDGMFLAALVGGQSLCELRDVLMQAEMEITGGVSPRVAPMVDLRDAAGLLQRAGFGLPVADSEMVTVSYRNLFHLMQDLRGMGWTNVLMERHKKFTRRALFLRAAELYVEKYPDPDGIKASFELIYLIGWCES